MSRGARSTGASRRLPPRRGRLTAGHWRRVGVFRGNIALAAGRHRGELANRGVRVPSLARVGGKFGGNAARARRLEPEAEPRARVIGKGAGRGGMGGMARKVG